LAPGGIAAGRKRDLGTTINSIKGRSAREANLLLDRNGPKFWAKDYFDRRIRDNDHAERVTRYIENNPVKAGLCGSATDWPRSSAARKNAPEVACTNSRVAAALNV
jgi:putative transposase